MFIGICSCQEYIQAYIIYENVTNDDFQIKLFSLGGEGKVFISLISYGQKKILETTRESCDRPQIYRGSMVVY